jgi:mono/diheme cytochrome c family protein
VKFGTPAFVTASLVLATGCRTENVFVELDPSTNRMIEQPRVDPYETLAALGTPPEGTQPYTAGAFDPLWLEGKDDSGFARTIPRPLTRAALAIGHARFETFCAACHGVLGNGVSVPARFMGRPPPSLHEQHVRELAPGDVFQTITRGYGVMPSYAAPLSVSERWAVVGYVQALQLSQAALLAELPPALAREFGEHVQ